MKIHSLRSLAEKWAGTVAVLLAASAVHAIGPIDPPIQKGSIGVQFQTIGTGLVAPTDMTFAPDGSGRQFIVDQVGTVRILQNRAILPDNFLDVRSQLVTLRTGYDERGLLGLAFHPGFNNPASPGFRKLYTYQNEPVVGAGDFTVPMTGAFDNQAVLSEWTVSAANPNQVDPASKRVLMRVDHPQFNHDGGEISFGPDGMLYIGMGDGGNANDTGPGHNPTTGNAQDLSRVLGKVLRIDPTGNNSANGRYGIPADNPFVGPGSPAGALPEIYAYGFRNPFRFSFAPNGQLYLGDVGQNNIEEVDIVVPGGNYGWNIKEGTFLFNPADGTIGASTPGSPAGLIDPILEYDHDEGIAILGGFVYHGTYFPELVGKYVFGDFSTSFTSPRGRLFYADLSTGVINEFNTLPLGLFLKGMGEGPDGEIYILGGTALGPSGSSGVILQIVPEPGALLAMLAPAGLLLRRRR